MKHLSLLLACFLAGPALADSIEIPFTQFPVAISQGGTGITTGTYIQQTATPFSTAYGTSACLNATGANNACFGYQSGLILTSGVNNAFFGYRAGTSVAAGGNNTAVGHNAVAGVAGSSFNTGVGSATLQSTTGADNTCVGYGCMSALSSGHDNVGLGYLAGSGITTGTQNLVLGNCTSGFSAGTSTTIDLCTGDNVLHIDWGLTNASEWTIKGNIVNTGTTPTIASGACGTGTNGSIAGTDNSGLVTIGAAATTSCTISFHATLAVAPNACVITAANATAAGDIVSSAIYVSSITTAQFVITGSALASNNFYYFCL